MCLSTRKTSPRRCTQSGRANVFFLGKLTTLKNDARTSQQQASVNHHAD